MRYLLPVTLSAISLFIVACGKDGGSAKEVLPPEKPTGRFEGSIPTQTDSWYFQAIHYDAAVKRKLTGFGYVVAVVDTGIDVDHPYLSHLIHPKSARIYTGEILKDFNDRHGHGTSMSSLVAGADLSSGSLIGVAPGAKIMVLATDDIHESHGIFNSDDVGRAIDYAVEHGANIINLSMGAASSKFSSPDIQAVSRATSFDRIVFLATGNEGPDGKVSRLAYYAGHEAYHDLGVAVTSLSTNGESLSSFASPCEVYDPNFCISVPGSSLRQGEIKTEYNHAGLGYGSGTSQATAIASGAMAILLEAFPNLTPKEALQIMLKTADDLGEQGVDRVYGVGRLNLERALQPVGPVALSNGTSLSKDDAVVINASAMGQDLADSGVLKALSVYDAYNRPYEIDMGQAVVAQKDMPEWPDNEQRLNIQFEYGDLPLKYLDRVGFDFGNLDTVQNTGSALHFISSRRDVVPFADLFLGQARAEGQGAGWQYSAQFALGGEEFAQNRYVAGALAKEFGASTVSFGVSHFLEDGAFLGSMLSGAFGDVRGANTTGFHVSFEQKFGDYSGFARGYYGMSKVDLEEGAGIVRSVSDLRSNSFAIGLGKDDTFYENDRIDFAIAQSERVSSGDIFLNPNLASAETISLVPDGREFDFELGYRARLSDNLEFSSQFLHRINPDHELNSDAQSAIGLELTMTF